jgi:hypothetical protein
MGERRGACVDLVVKPEGKRSLRKARRGGEYNIKSILEGVNWEDVD